MHSDDPANIEKPCNNRLIDSIEQLTIRIRPITDWLAAHRITGADLYFMVLLLLAAFFLLRWPIVAFDTDLWTHLNGGRYFFEQGKIPDSSFYSFLTPERKILSYSWLFKVLIYQIYSISGYSGIIIFRTLICLCTLAVVYCYLRRSLSGTWLMILFLLYLMLFIDIGSDQRPYNISFLMIAGFLFILEYHPRKIWLLPLLAVIWINIHGVEYPVMMLILSSYLLRYLQQHWLKPTGGAGRSYPYLIVLGLTFLAVFASPHGLNLLWVPFTDTSYAAQYINELRPVFFDDLFTFRLHDLVPEFKTVANTLFFVVTFCVLVNLARRQIAFHHLLLFAGGVFLLTKGVRFVHEFALLALPCLKPLPRLSARSIPVAARNAILAVVLPLMLAAPFAYLNALYGNRPKYPLAGGRLPVGIAAFFDRVSTGGRLLNDPTVGGYLGWRLWPDIRIYMDMQVPFLFTNEDIFMGINALYNKEGFKRFVSMFQPDYIAIPMGSPLHKSVLKQSARFVPVFFDDMGALYVDRLRHPSIAERYRLEHIRPFIDDSRDTAGQPTEAENGFLREAQRMLEIYPDGLLINRQLAAYHLRKKSFAAAAQHAERLIANFPDLAEGYRRMGDIQREQQAFADALPFYRKALDRADRRSQSDLHKSMWACYFGLRQYRAAYRSLKKAVNYFSPHIATTDLYRMAQTSYQVGRFEEASMLATFAAFKTEKKSPRQEAQISNLLKNLEKSYQ